MTLLVDTSFLFALTNRRDKSHTLCAQFAQTIREPLVVATTVLPEICYLLDMRLGYQIMRQFVAQLSGGAWGVEPVTHDDLPRTAELLTQYHDNHLDFVDATLITVAERLNIQRVLTLDRRHFTVIRPRHCATFEILP